MTRVAWAGAGMAAGSVAALGGLLLLFAVLFEVLVGVAVALIVGGALAAWLCLVAVNTDDEEAPR